MKKHVFEILLVVTIIFILASCKTPRYAYAPSAHNVPVITQKAMVKSVHFIQTIL